MITAREAGQLQVKINDVKYAQDRLDCAYYTDNATVIGPAQQNYNEAQKALQDFIVSITEK